MKVSKVVDGIYRGPEPQSFADWKQLQDMQIKYTLDLETGCGLLKDGDPAHNKTIATSYGIKTFDYPLGEVLPPKANDLDAALAVIDQFQPIYVHCRAGVDRTGMVIAAYRIRHGMSKQDAIAEMKAMGMHWWYFFWAWSL